ncbi:hypothetical protein [Oleiharenicola sp. Vm1]|uniref:hypothetical protein n=1 Tax=Oleiharenicola sp. Vm1 TaxID=3398393 RepID=UPI0039F4E2FA
MRDRRDALVTNASFKLMHTVGRWQLRPAANFHYQDFDTPHRRLSGCANYIDRSELFVGADLARQLAANTFVIAGYRIGAQRQYKLYGIDRPYDRRIDRFLAGFEGTLHPGLQLTALVGPEIRHYAAGTAADFDRAERPWWVDASLTFKPSPQRSVALCFRRQTLPSSSSLGIYASGTWELTWRERLSDHCSVAAGLKLARGDWMAPALREDRIVTPFACYTRSLGPRRQLELTWTFDDAISRVPATPGRASHRDVASVSYRDAL